MSFLLLTIPIARLRIVVFSSIGMTWPVQTCYTNLVSVYHIDNLLRLIWR